MFKEIVKQAKAIVSAVDNWDDKTIEAVDKISHLSFIPESAKVAVDWVKKYEPRVINALAVGLNIAESFGEKNEKEFKSKEEKSQAKLNIALQEVKAVVKEDKDPVEMINSAVALVKSFL